MTRRLICAVSWVLLMAGSLEAGDRIMASPERAFSAFSHDRARRFDFWIGEWDVNLRIQQDDLSFKDSIRARAHIYRILNGKAILELWDSEPIKGYSLRYFDPERGKWVLWLGWPQPNRSGVSSLVGEFRHGRGDFQSMFVNAEGKELLQRYSFSDITPFSLRWDDHYSADGGKTWGQNWRMEFVRSAIEPGWPIDRAAVPTWTDGRRCDAGSFRPYETIAGSWAGPGGRVEAYRVLDGCAVLGFVEASERSEFFFITFAGEDQGWETDVLDDRPGTPLVRYTSTSGWSSFETDDSSLEWSIEGDRLLYRRGDLDLELERSSSPPVASEPLQVSPGCVDERARQFDFWIGDWEVYSAGDLAGHNSIQPILDGCVLQESWKGIRGSAGSSFNFFDPRIEKWRQFWVWRNGTTLELEGSYDGGRMILMGESLDGDGNPLRNRIIWYHNDDGTVRQHWEVSSEEADGWQTAFDGLYRQRR